MAQTEKDIEKCLKSRLKLESPTFIWEHLPGGKLSGSLVSATFVGLGDTERQSRIWKALEDEFGAQSTQRVGTLLAYTPAEWNVELVD